ncbi:MAG: hypothetical protein ACRCTA_01630, partial [Bacilli bacterium]
MKFYQRAYLSVTRNSGKYLIYFLLVLVLSLGLALSFNIKNMLQQTITSIEATASTEVILDLSLNEGINEEELINELSSLPYVKTINKTKIINNNISLLNTKSYLIDESNEETKNINFNTFEGVESKSISLLDHNIATISEGSFIVKESESNGLVIVLSSEFATVNKIKLNDYVSLKVKQYPQSYYDYINENKTINESILPNEIILEGYQVIGLMDIDENKLIFSPSKNELEYYTPTQIKEIKT